MASPSPISAMPGRLLALMRRPVFSPLASPLPFSPFSPSSTQPLPTTTTATATRTIVSSASRRAGPLPPSRGTGGPHGAVPQSRSKRMLAERDPRIRALDKALYKLTFVPPPLRMGRNRYLRHWTIHRAWLLQRRQAREARERELMQQYQSMHAACEALRPLQGPGGRDTGYLYRVAMEKKGVYRHGGVPIEYARAQTETPAREAWNHGWKR